MSRVRYSVALANASHDALAGHLLQHLDHGLFQEDLCFAIWFPSTGRTRYTALVGQPLLPEDGERNLHGNASFEARYFERALAIAVANNAGLVFLHSHPSSGWQSMSPDDVTAEQQRLAARVYGATGLPLLGMTIGTDRAWSARFWEREGRGRYARKWCGTVRVIADNLAVTYMEDLAPAPKFRDELLRTYSSWGEKKQQAQTRLRVGVIGLGSIGGFVAESLARHGYEDILLMDFDTVKKHNLDRLLYATPADIGRLKVEVAADSLRRHATASNFRVEALGISLTTEQGFQAALDCDVLFSCVDMPWPRNLLNIIAYAHRIPVIDGGIQVALTERGNFRGADWRAHTVMGGRKCLECLGQYDPADVALEREGFFDSPSYTAGLPKSHFIHRNQNVFGFSMAAASLEFLQLLALTVAPYGLAAIGGQMYHFTSGSIAVDKPEPCGSNCLFPALEGKGDAARIAIFSSTVVAREGGGSREAPQESLFRKILRKIFTPPSWIGARR